MTGDYESIKDMNPHLDDEAVKALIEESHRQRIEQAKRDAEIEAAKINKMRELGIDVEANKEVKTRSNQSSASENQGNKALSNAPKQKINNPAKHAEQSSIQPGKNGDQRKSDKTKRAEKQKRIESGSKED